MQPFDCLSLNCPLFGPHLLEASAGTGKTFSIEHIYVRLVLESLGAEKILAVTFTRAATRELKMRIRQNLEKAHQSLKEGVANWEYLTPYLGSIEAIRALEGAIATFDRSQIFTIHGFCYRMLKECDFFLSDPDEGKKIPDSLYYGARDFIHWGLNENLLCPEQVALLTQEYRSFDEILDRLLHLEKMEGASFEELFNQCKAALHEWPGSPIEEEKLLEDFRAVEKNYKALSGDHAAQVAAIAGCFLGNIKSFRLLLKEKGSLFAFLDSSNRKVKTSPPPFLHYPGFFDWAEKQLGSILKQTPKKVLQTLGAAWRPIAEKILAEEGFLDPDAIVFQMKEEVANEAFADHVRKKYEAVIIDEFQDTDPFQWEIFQTLFLGPKASLRALYFVGDPKQSIYRFRKADVYTYLKARDLLGPSHIYQLETNFRSSKELIGALNFLFCRDWLYLPQTKNTLSYTPVRAGKEISFSFPDEKGALHVIQADGLATFEGVFLPYAAAEIEKLSPQKHSIAILVRTNQEANQALEFLQNRGIQAIAKSNMALGETVAFQAIHELFNAILSGREKENKIVGFGPFGQMDCSLRDAQIFLEERGLVSFCRHFIKPKKLDPVIEKDCMQIFESLFAWEKREGFSFDGLRRFLFHLKDLKADEGGRRQADVQEEAVQIMTLHIAKGLEFDVVFALGLVSRSFPSEEDEEEEELDAEKLRQLYVAMTRAKKRLYVPYKKKDKTPQTGRDSPIELFSRYFDLEQVTTLSHQESITFESIPTPFLLPPVILKPKIENESHLLPSALSFTPSYLHSFTSLAQAEIHDTKWKEPSSHLFTLHTLPRGKETGIAIHSLFETLFSSPKTAWHDSGFIENLVADKLQFSSLLPWKECIEKMIRQTMALPLQAEEEFFSLGELDPAHLQVEVEFLYSRPPHFLKGFIDLLFFHRGKYYFVDWKTNWLGDSDADYSFGSLLGALSTHDYRLQARLYTEALRRHLNVGEKFSSLFGGAFYLFLRGNTSIHLRSELL